MTDLTPLEILTRVMTPERKSAIAFHEAGHAVMAWLLRKTIVHMTIVMESDPEDGRFVTMGSVTSKKRTRRRTGRTDDPIARSADEHEVMVAMAGPLAEGMHLGKYIRPRRGDREMIADHSRDHHGAWTVGSNSDGFDEDRLRSACHKSYLDWLKARTLFALNADWPLVEATAAALLEKGTLNGPAFRRLIRKTLAELQAERCGHVEDARKMVTIAPGPHGPRGVIGICYVKGRRRGNANFHPGASILRVPSADDMQHAPRRVPPRLGLDSEWRPTDADSGSAAVHVDFHGFFVNGADDEPGVIAVYGGTAKTLRQSSYRR